LWEEEVGMDHR